MPRDSTDDHQLPRKKVGFVQGSCRYKIDPNTQSLLQQTPLSYAVKQQSMQLTELLLQSGQVDVNCKDSTGCTPLMLAVSSGNMLMVKVLLKHTGIDILARDKVGNPAYAYAC